MADKTCERLAEELENAQTQEEIDAINAEMAAKGCEINRAPVDPQVPPAPTPSPSPTPTPTPGG